MNKNRVQGFVITKEGIGTKIIFNYATINEKGIIVASNQRGNFICMDDELQKHIDAIEDYIENQIIE